MTELTNYQEWQLSRYGDILPEPVVQPDGHTEASQAEQNRQAEWTELQYERQLHEYDDQYTNTRH